METIPRGEMVSRRKILSRSRDDLNLEQQYQQQQMQEDEDDVWYQKDKLYKVSKRIYDERDLHIFTQLIQKDANILND